MCLDNYYNVITYSTWGVGRHLKRIIAAAVRLRPVRLGILCLKMGRVWLNTSPAAPASPAPL